MTSPTDPHLLRELRDWHHELPALSRPEWDDVEIVVRLGVRDGDGVRRLLLNAPERVKDRLPEILAIVGRSAPSSPPTQVPSPAVSAAAPVVAEPPAGSDASLDSRLSGDPATTAQPEPDPLISGLRGLAERRMRALLAWRSGQSDDDLAGVFDKNFQFLAENGAGNDRIWSRVNALARFRGELTDLLSRVDNGEQLELDGSQVDAAVSSPGPAVDEVAVAPGSPTPSSGGQVNVGAPAHPGQVQAATSGARSVGSISPTGFAPFDYALDPPPGPAPIALEFVATGGESLMLRWPEPESAAPVRIYRVVTHESYVPDDSPELGSTIAITTSPEAVDDEAFVSPVRHAAVWVNEGGSEREAKAAQPRLHAVGSTVLPVRDLDVREDEGTVIGQWSAMAGLHRIDVFRVPIDVALRTHHYNAGQQLSAEMVSQGGFTDSEAKPGMEYEYRVYAFASLNGDGEEFSPYVARSVRIAAVIRPVNDLEVRPHHGSNEVFDLTWTKPPQGTVEIYRTARSPASGIDASVLERSALERAGLTSETRLRRPVNELDGVGAMVEVPWPEGWSRAYFTPVTVLNDSQMRVGPSRVLVRAGRVDQVRLIERVDEQFLTFAWPDGAATVKVFQGPRDTELGDPEEQTPLHELSDDEYRKFGGVHLRNPLPREGCSVHLVATTYSQARATHGVAVTVQYPGLLRIDYNVRTVEPAQRGGFFGAGHRPERSGLRHVVVRADQAATNLPVVLVHHPNRLPLHPGDGHEVQRRGMTFAAGAETTFAEALDVTGRPGFLRVFVDAPAERAHLVAVLDPPVASLRCD